MATKAAKPEQPKPKPEKGSTLKRDIIHDGKVYAAGEKAPSGLTAEQTARLKRIGAL